MTDNKTVPAIPDFSPDTLYVDFKGNGDHPITVTAGEIKFETTPAELVKFLAESYMNYISLCKGNHADHPEVPEDKRLIVSFETHGNDAGWVAFFPAIPGMIEQGATKAEAWQELIKSLEVKIAHDSGMTPDELKELRPSLGYSLEQAEQIATMFAMMYSINGHTFETWSQTEQGKQLLRTQ